LNSPSSIAEERGISTTTPSVPTANGSTIVRTFTSPDNRTYLNFLQHLKFSDFQLVSLKNTVFFHDLVLYSKKSRPTVLGGGYAMNCLPRHFVLRGRPSMVVGIVSWPRVEFYVSQNLRYIRVSDLFTY
jgi:hypothetical protein